MLGPHPPGLQVLDLDALLPLQPAQQLLLPSRLLQDHLAGSQLLLLELLLQGISSSRQGVPELTQGPDSLHLKPRELFFSPWPTWHSFTDRDGVHSEVQAHPCPFVRYSSTGTIHTHRF